MRFDNQNGCEFTAPNIKVRVDKVRYITSGGTVHCFMTMQDMKSFDPYMQLVRACEAIGMTIAKHPQFNCLFDRWQYNKVSASPNRIYLPQDYEYHGIAVLKPNDITDPKTAQAIAYKKAYRQMVGFYYNCYFSLYNRLMSYASDVWCDQLAQLSDRYIDADREITTIVEQ